MTIIDFFDSLTMYTGIKSPGDGEIMPVPRTTDRQETVVCSGPNKGRSVPVELITNRTRYMAIKLSSAAREH